MKLFLLSVILLFTIDVFAYGEDPLADAPPIKNRKFFLKKRHKISPIFGITFNDNYTKNFLNGFTYSYGITEWASFGVELIYGIGFNTDLANEIEKEYEKDNPSFMLSVSSIKFVGNVFFNVVPVYGKINVFNKYFLPFNFHFLGGAGFAMTRGSGTLKSYSKFSPFFGGGLTVFLTDMISVSIDIKDYLIYQAQAVPVVETKHIEEKYVSNLAFFIGINFFIPPEVSVEK